MKTFSDILGRPEGPAVGTVMKLPAIEAVEMLKLGGFDFVVIDSEHAMYSHREIDTLIFAAHAVDLVPIVRVPDHGYGDVQRILDAGAGGIWIPHVSNGAEAKTVVSQMIHPPAGVRGNGGGMRAADWGQSPQGRANYVDPDRVARILMIEEKVAVDNAEEIVATPGISAVFIGPGDLSMTMGLPMSDPAVQDAIEATFKACKAAGVTVGTIAPDGAGGKRLADHGYDFVVVSNDVAIIAKGARDLVAEVRS